MKPETRFYQNTVKPMLKKLSTLRYDRIENCVGQGYPDLDLTWEGVNYKCELKCISRGNKIGIRPEQVNWHRKERKAGGRCGFLVKWKERIFGFDIDDVDQTQSILKVKNIIEINNLDDFKEFLVSL